MGCRPLDVFRKILVCVIDYVILDGQPHVVFQHVFYTFHTLFKASFMLSQKIMLLWDVTVKCHGNIKFFTINDREHPFSKDVIGKFQSISKQTDIYIVTFDEFQYSEKSG